MNQKLPKIKIPEGRELRGQITLIIGAIISLYMIVATAQALWQNYQLNRELVSLRETAAELKLENKYLQNLIAYRKTDSFQDREARAKLNYQKPGETVLIIPEDDTARFREGNINAPTDTPTDDKPTNPEKWWIYIFG